MKYCNLRLKKYFFKIILIHCFCCFVVRNSSQLFAESQCLVTTTRQGGSEVFKPPNLNISKKGQISKIFVMIITNQFARSVSGKLPGGGRGEWVG